MESGITNENRLTETSRLIQSKPTPPTDALVKDDTKTETVGKNDPYESSKGKQIGPDVEYSIIDVTDTRSENPEGKDLQRAELEKVALHRKLSLADMPAQDNEAENPCDASSDTSPFDTPPETPQGNYTVSSVSLDLESIAAALSLTIPGTPAKQPKVIYPLENYQDICLKKTPTSLVIATAGTQAKAPIDDSHGETCNDIKLDTKLPSLVTAFDDTAGTPKEINPGLASQCPNHAGCLLLQFCSTCNTAVCERCIQTDHKDHPTIGMHEAATIHRASLTTLLSKLRLMTPEVERAVAEAEDTHKQLEVNTAETEAKITTLFDELASLLEEKRRTALAELAQVSASREAVLHKQKESLRHRLEGIRNCCQIMDHVVQGERDIVVVMAKTQVERHLPDLLTPTLDLQSQTTSPTIAYDERDFDVLKKMVSIAGSGRENSSPDPHQTTVTGDALNGCLTGKMATVTVTTRDIKGNIVKTGLSSLSSYIASDKEETRMSVAIVDMFDGTHEIRLVLPKPGQYLLNVFLSGQPTNGSPYQITVSQDAGPAGSDYSRTSRSLVAKETREKRLSCSRSGGSCSRLARPVDDDLILRVGVRGRNKGEFSNPQGVCCHGDTVVVADSSNQAVQVFSMAGECSLKFGSPGCCPGKIQRPTGVTVNHSGNYLVADYDNKWISVFSLDGRYISHLGVGSLQGPKGVAVDRDDHIIVVDNKCNSVLVFQPNGRLINKFGSRGPYAEQLAGPHYVATNDDCDIIVTDFHNHCVKVYDINGKFKFSFGSNGEGIGQFNAPTGVAVDDKGNILVADWGNSRIQVFDSSGSFLSYVNTSSEPLSGPQGLAVTAQSVVVVADSGNHCIKYYKYLQ